MNKLTVLCLAVMVALSGCSSDDNKNENNIISVDNTIAVGSEQCIIGVVETHVGAYTNNNDVL
ncbi:alkaline phosphatase, partial [Pseudoalteromonas issachenkonii]